MGLGRPISLTGNVASKRINTNAIAGQTEFTVAGGYRINQITVYRNGVRLAQEKDFTADDGSKVTLQSVATADDLIAFEIYDDFRVADAIQSNVSAQTINGDLTITGSLTAGLSSVAYATTSFDYYQYNDITAKTGNFTDVNVSGSATVSGQLSVGGTINYEDVTNVDSVGIVTAGAGVRILTGGLNIVGWTTGLHVSGVSTLSGWVSCGDTIALGDSKGIYLGADEDLSIYHDGSDSYVEDTGTGSLLLRSDTHVRINKQSAAESMATFNPSGSCEFFFNNSKKLETTTAGIVVTGISTADDFTIGVGGTSVHTALAAKATTGKAIAMAMIFG